MEMEVRQRDSESVSLGVGIRTRGTIFACCLVRGATFENYRLVPRQSSLQDSA